MEILIFNRIIMDEERRLMKSRMNGNSAGHLLVAARGNGVGDE